MAVDSFVLDGSSRMEVSRTTSSSRSNEGNNRRQQQMLRSWERNPSRKVFRMTKHRIGWRHMERLIDSATSGITRKKGATVHCEKRVIDDRVTAKTRIWSWETDLSSICENPTMLPSLFLQNVSSRTMGRKKTNGRIHITIDSTSKSMPMPRAGLTTGLIVLQHRAPKL